MTKGINRKLIQVPSEAILCCRDSMAARALKVYSKGSCHNCGIEGHHRRDCLSNSKGNSFRKYDFKEGGKRIRKVKANQNRKSKKQELYVSFVARGLAKQSPNLVQSKR